MRSVARHALVALGSLLLATTPVLAVGKPAPSPAADPSPAGWTYVAFGDSNVYAPAEVCGSCTGYPHLLAERITAELGMPVRLIDGSQWNRLTTHKLRAEIERDSWGEGWEQPRDPSHSPRSAIAAADLITITIGGNDWPSSQDPDPCAGTYDQACIDLVVPAYRTDLERIFSEIETIREGRPAAILVTNQWNDMIAGPDYDPTWFYTPDFLETNGPGLGALIRAFNAATVEVVAAHGATLIDINAIANGPDGTAALPAGWYTKEFGDLNQPGQDAFAAEMLRVGFAPLVAPGT